MTASPSIHQSVLRTEPSDGFEIPSILRRQGIRYGSTIAGQALSTAGVATTLSGVRASRESTGKSVRYSTITREQARLSKTGIEPNTRYRPSGDAASNRYMSRRLRRTAVTQKPGVMRIRMGSTMMVAGKVVPVLAVGYLAYELLPESRKKDVVETDLGSGGSLKDRATGFLDLGTDVYTGVTIGYAVGKNLLGVFFA